jgi:hypothetical protein
MPTSLRRFVLSAVLGLLLGCASTERYSLHTATSYDDAFRAVAQTLPTIDWFVVSSDSSTGVISATRRLTGARTTDRQLRLSLVLQRDERGVAIAVTFIPPGMAFGSARGEFEELSDVLRRRLPDVAVIEQ